MSDKHEDIDEPVDDAAFDALVAQLPDALRDPAVWAEPPPWLADSIVAAIADERAEAAPAVAAPAAPAAPAKGASSAAAPPDLVARRSGCRHRHRRRRRDHRDTQQRRWW